MISSWACGRLFRLRLLVKYPSLPIRVCRNHSDSSIQITDISNVLSKPSWSVRSLLPSPFEISATTRVTSEQLRHLLRLSALPPPQSLEEETRMLETLDSQLHFVREIQKLKIDSVAPLKSIRDESATADSECEIGCEELKGALDAGDISKKGPRIGQRITSISGASKEVEDWDVLGQAERRVGQYFVVETRQK